MLFDLIYLIPFVVLIITGIATYYGKITLTVALTGIIIALGISYWLVPYQTLIIEPLSASLWHGYAWTLLPIVAVIHIGTLIVMTVLAIYNLYLSGGKKLWA